MKHTPSRPDKPIRLSLAWVVTGFIIIVLLGVMGGVIAEQFFNTAPTLVGTDNDRLSTTVQQVVISPNRAAADIVEKVQASVLLLVGPPAGSLHPTNVATAWMVTNDGLLVTAADLPDGQWQAFDYQGVVVPVDFVGRDALFGLSYFRVTTGLFPSSDLRQQDPVPASRLLALDRSPTTFAIRAHDYLVQEYTLPTNTSPAGIQRLISGTPLLSDKAQGSPLFDEEGRVAAIVLKPAEGVALPVSQLQQSLQRVTQGQRELNPWQDLGLEVDFGLRRLQPAGPQQFMAEVMTVQSNSRAAEAGLRVRDLIVAIEQEPLSWTTSVVTKLSSASTPTFTIRRQDQELTVSIPPRPNP